MYQHSMCYVTNAWKDKSFKVTTLRALLTRISADLYQMRILSEGDFSESPNRDMPN